MSKKRKKHIGSSFEDFLKEDGTYEEITTQAIKRVLAWQIAESMKGPGHQQTGDGAAHAYQPQPA